MEKINKRIHIIVLSLNERNGGGSHHNAISFIRFLKKENYEVVVHTLTSSKNEPPADIRIVQHEIHLSFTVVRNSVVSLLNKYQSEADLFFLYGTDFAWSGGKYRKDGGKIPVVVYLDNYLGSMKLGQWQGTSYFLKRFFWDKLIGLRYASFVDSFFAVSPFLKEKYVNFGFPEKKVHVIPNFFKINENLNKVSLPRADDTVKLLYAGRLTYDKGIDLLLTGATHLPKDINWQLRIVGEGPLKQECIDFISKNNLGSKVVISPWLDAKALSSEYEAADIFVHPARWPEPFGRTIVEALEFGVPVIVPEQGGSSWIAKGGGLEFINGDGKSLQEALNKIIGDSELRKSLGRIGKERIKMFSEELIGPTFLNQIENLIQ